MELLTEKLRALATDGNKHRAKVDKRKQRSVFRDVLRAVEVIFLAFMNVLIVNHVAYNSMKVTVSVKKTKEVVLNEISDYSDNFPVQFIKIVICKFKCNLFFLGA